MGPSKYIILWVHKTHLPECMGDELCGIYLQYFWEMVVTMCLYVIAMTSTLCTYLPLWCSLGDLLPHRRCSCCQLHVMILQHLTAYSHAIVHIASVYMASNTCRGLEGSFCVCVCVSVCIHLSIHAWGYVYDHTCQSTFRYHLFHFASTVRSKCFISLTSSTSLFVETQILRLTNFNFHDLVNTLKDHIEILNWFFPLYWIEYVTHCSCMFVYCNMHRYCGPGCLHTVEYFISQHHYVLCFSHMLGNFTWLQM